LDKDILFYNHNNICIYKNNLLESDKESNTSKSIKEYLPQHLSDMQDMYSFEIDDVPYLIIPIEHNLSYYGSIIIKDMGQPVSDVNLLLINQTANALSVSLLSYERMDDYNLRMKQSFLQDLAVGLAGDKAQIISQAKKLDLNLEDKSALIIVQFYPEESEHNHDNHINHIRKIIKITSPQDIVFTLKDHNQLVALSFASNIKSKIFDDAVNKINKYSKDNKINLRIGVGPYPSDLTKVNVAYQEIADSIDISQKLSFDTSYVSCNEMKVFDLFYRSIDRTVADKVVTEMLAPVRTYDAEHGTELEETFATLLSYNLSTAKVADNLFIHRNTVLQRKKNIESLYVNNPFSDEERPKFNLVFLLKDLYVL
ncbi:MAG: helix-turn-helix domain-containing protein, partial [Dysgonamonadaceae bacterium]|nr:helix-turn-helix domain-containing protein [Dysgonamonadaceae bacterium]